MQVRRGHLERRTPRAIRRYALGVDSNEDCPALAALTKHGIEDSVAVDHPEIKEERHRHATMGETDAGDQADSV
ncbi:hypothetical protein [Halorientalis sp.]|uniref:hypothetical protein n=1 Tax=Halorientalis sp. TaxID=1931229 RepID=UPI0026108838|nr:hypothetical protein [Halorientalis sp.]